MCLLSHWYVINTWPGDVHWTTQQRKEDVRWGYSQMAHSLAIWWTLVSQAPSFWLVILQLKYSQTTWKNGNGKGGWDIQHTTMKKQRSTKCEIGASFLIFWLVTEWFITVFWALIHQTVIYSNTARCEFQSRAVTAVKRVNTCTCRTHSFFLSFRWPWENLILTWCNLMQCYRAFLSSIWPNNFAVCVFYMQHDVMQQSKSDTYAHRLVIENKNTQHGYIFFNI